MSFISRLTKRIKNWWLLVTNTSMAWGMYLYKDEKPIVRHIKIFCFTLVREFEILFNQKPRIMNLLEVTEIENTAQKYIGKEIELRLIDAMTGKFIKKSVYKLIGLSRYTESIVTKGAQKEVTYRLYAKLTDKATKKGFIHGAKDIIALFVKEDEENQTKNTN